MRSWLRRLAGRARGLLGPRRTLPRPWFDEPDAADQVRQRAAGDPLLERVGAAVVEQGFAVVPGLISPELCADAVRDFGRFLARLGSAAEAHRDPQGRYLRVVNLHSESAAARAIGLDPGVMRILDFLFGAKACVYTSLYFEHGTQQPLHRDLPFFETFPRNYFMGVWVALEDIHPDSGPLMYVPRAHRFACDPAAIHAEVAAQYPGLDTPELLDRCERLYNRRVMDQAAAIAAPVPVILRKGDVAFWHPAAPHGGSPARDLTLTRRSIVFHCSPEAVQVHQQEAFFLRNGVEPLPRYGFARFGDRKVALAGDAQFQVPYRAPSPN